VFQLNCQFISEVSISVVQLDWYNLTQVQASQGVPNSIIVVSFIVNVTIVVDVVGKIQDALFTNVSVAQVFNNVHSI